MKRPVIGIVPLVDETKESYWMLPGYMKGIESAGGIPVMIPLTSDPAAIRQLAETLDGFLFTGGHDVSPLLYGEVPLPVCGTLCKERDEAESLLLDAVLGLDKPVLGICRGIQFLNVFLGGSLYQDLPSQYPSPIEHHQTPPYDIPVHQVTVCPGTPLYKLLQKPGNGIASSDTAAYPGNGTASSDTAAYPGNGTASSDAAAYSHRERLLQLAVNSYHHQAIRDLSPQLRPMAVSEDDLIEAVYLPEHKFVWAVQWHPEFSYRTDPVSRKIFEVFIAAAD